MTFDWRYRGFTVLELLTEDEVDELNKELDRLRLERNQNEPEKWQEFEAIMHPHKVSEKIQKMFAHPKMIEACEFLMEGDIIGMQTWGYYKPKGELGRDHCTFSNLVVKIKFNKGVVFVECVRYDSYLGF